MTKTNEHHRRSVRLPDYNYSSPGGYYITICTQNHRHLFDEVIDGETQLNKYGKIAEDCLQDLPEHFPDVELDQYVIMPNHIHAIIIIKPDMSVYPLNENNRSFVGRGTVCRAPTDNLNVNREQFGKPISGSIPTIIRSYKSAVTRLINIQRQTPGARVWQRNYYEHVLRGEKDLYKFRRYIANNPITWDKDEYFREVL